MHNSLFSQWLLPNSSKLIFSFLAALTTVPPAVVDQNWSLVMSSKIMHYCLERLRLLPPAAAAGKLRRTTQDGNYYSVPDL